MTYELFLVLAVAVLPLAGCADADDDTAGPAGDDDGDDDDASGDDDSGDDDSGDDDSGDDDSGDDDSGDDDSAPGDCAPTALVDPACTILAGLSIPADALENVGCPTGESLFTSAAAWATWLASCSDFAGTDPLAGHDWGSADVVGSVRDGPGDNAWGELLWLADCPDGLHLGATCGHDHRSAQGAPGPTTPAP